MNVAFIQANTNGRLHPANEPSLAPLNRGFLYGDAIYEVWRTYHGVIFAWQEHWERLERSAKALYMRLPLGAEEMLGEIRRTVSAFRTAASYLGEVYIRLQISRGTGPIGLDPALVDQPEFVLLVQANVELTPEKISGGLLLSVATALRRNPAECMSPAWKTGNYMNNLLCLREAKSRGADEVIILNLAGEVTEAAVCNVAFAEKEAVITPPVSAGILSGITRGLLLEKIAATAGIPMREAAVRPGDFGKMTECFLLSTTKDIVPVAAIDAAKFKVGPDTVAMRLKAAFAEYAQSYATAHPKQRV
jgi:branched-chain amino acid aminotransferase